MVKMVNSPKATQEAKDTTSPFNGGSPAHPGPLAKARWPRGQLWKCHTGKTALPTRYPPLALPMGAIPGEMTQGTDRGWKSKRPRA